MVVPSPQRGSIVPCTYDMDNRQEHQSSFPRPYWCCLPQAGLTIAQKWRKEVKKRKTDIEMGDIVPEKDKLY